jgi:hypothetical protein
MIEADYEFEADPTAFEPTDDAEPSELAEALAAMVERAGRGDHIEGPELHALLRKLQPIVEDWDRYEDRADFGEHAKDDDDPNSALPKPDPEGRFLTIVNDPYAKGHLWMRRYATKEDAVCVPINWTGGDSWVFEIVREIPRKDMMDWDGFWAGE